MQKIKHLLVADDYPKDAEFDTIKVNNEATFTVDDEQI